MDSADAEKDIPEFMKTKPSQLAVGTEVHDEGAAQNETAADADNIAAAIKNVQDEGTPSDVQSQESAENAALSTIQQLSELPSVQYTLRRKKAAAALGISMADLDREVIALRRQRAESVAGSDMGLHTPEPWPDTVDGAVLLEQFAAEIKRHTILPAHAADAVALWCLKTYVFDCFMISPRLLLTSPDKRCGKSTLLGIIQQLAYKPVTTANASPASIFRLIEDVKPTILIDEADTFLESMVEARGIINSGHVKTSAYVTRTVGEEFKSKRFSTWAPMLIAQIGLPVATLLDRSIVIELQRKKKGEMVDKLDLASPLYAELRSKAQRWANDNAGVLGKMTAAVPASLHDRAADNWLPLATIASAVGKDWPRRTEVAACKLSAAAAALDSSHASNALSDIQQIFTEAGDIRMASADIIAAMCKLDHRHWGDWKHGKAITGRQLAELLAPFGIRPRTLRIGMEQYKGYALEDFEDAFERYVS